jgi:WD40 repeat protein
MEQRSIFFLRALVTVLTFALIGAGGLTGFALDRQQQAQIERDRARELALVNGAQAALYGENGDLALALAVAANLSDNPSGQAQMILGDAAYSPGTVYLLDGTTAPLTSAQFTPDGSTIVTTARDGQITRWDVATGTPLQAFQSSDGIGWWNNVLSPDGDTLAVLAADGSLELWNVGTEERYQHIRDDEAQASAVAFSSDVGTVVIGYTDGRLVLWNITTNTPDRTFAGHTTMVNSIAFNPANPDLFLSADNDGSVILWQTDSDHPLHVASAESSGHFSTAWADFAPDGNSIISVSRDNMMIVRRTETFEQIRRFALNAPLISLDVSPDGQSVLCGTGDGSVIVDLATGQLRLRLSGYASEVPAVSYSPDGSMALTLSQEGTARLWDVGYGAELWQQTLPSDGFSIALSPDRQRLAVGTLLSNPPDPARLILYDTNTGEELQRLATPDDYPFVVGDLAFSPDGTLLISIGDGSTILWDAMTGTELMRLETAGDVSFDNLFALFQYSVAFSLDGTIALTHDPSNGLALWNVQRESTSFGERILMITDTGSPATRSLFMPDGQSLLTGHTDGTLRLWDANTGTFLRSMGTPAPDNSRVIINLTIIQDGSVVYSAGADGIIRSWQVETGQVIHEFTGHVGQVNALVLSPDQQTLFSAGIDGTIIHWDTISAQPIRRYSSVIAPINALASDGQTLFSAEFGLTLRRWRVDTLPQLLNWTFEHRYVRELTCTERALYSVVPGCDLQGIYPTRTPFSLP